MDPAYIWIEIDKQTWQDNEVFKAFIKSNPNMKNPKGMSVLECAVRNNDADLVEYLVNETSVNTKVACTSGDALTDIAVQNAQRDVLALLLYGDAPSDIERMTEFNFTYNIDPDVCESIQDVIDKGGF